MKITGDVKTKEMIAYLKTRHAAVQLKVADAVTDTAHDTRNDVIKRIQRGPKTGETYKRGKKVHIASAPGESPATDRGGLVSSIYFSQKNAFLAIIGSRLKYAYWLEFGTTVTDARPSWFPALWKMRPIYRKRILKIYDKEWK